MTPETAYRLLPWSAFPIGRGEVILVSPSVSSPVRVPQTWLPALARMEGARPLVAHERAVATVAQAEAQAVVRGCVTAGLLRPIGPAVGQAAASADPGPLIGAVGIVTAGRPHLLRRCLTALLAHADVRQRGLRVIVVDGSLRDDHRRENAAIVAQVGDGPHVVTYVGATEARQLQAALVAGGCARSVVEWACTPGPTGANRNLVALHTVGQSVLWLDDDVVVDPWVSMHADPDLTLAGHADRREVRFFGGRHDALAAVERADVDLLAAHERLLGRSLRTCARERPVRATDACAHLLEALTPEAPEARIRLTMSGLVGDSGAGCHSRWLFATGTARQALQDPTVLPRALSRRDIARIAPGDLVTHAGGCMLYGTAVAPGPDLPPFLPVARSEDGLFGTMLSLTDPSGVMAHVAVGVVHDPDRPSAVEDALPPSATHLRLADLMQAYLESHRTPVPHPPQSLDAIADIVRGGTRLGPREWASHLRTVAVDQRVRELQRLEASCHAEASPAWREAVDRYRAVAVAYLLRRDFGLPLECRPGSSAPTDELEAAQIAAGFERVRDFCQRAADLLTHWTAMQQTSARVLGLDVPSATSASATSG